jgi:soluble lytic murein transglycosylase
MGDRGAALTGQAAPAHSRPMGRAWAARLAVCVAALLPPPAGAEARPGAVLGEAVAERAAGREREAIARLDAIERDWPLIGDHAARLAIEARAVAAAPDETFAAADRFATRYPDSLLRARVARLRGDAAAKLGRAEAARAAWREALEGTEASADRGALWLALARSEEAAGDLAKARGDYLAAWNAVPTSPVAVEADAALGALERAGTLPARDALDWSSRGEALAGAGLHVEAVAAYDRALAMSPPPALRASLLRARAHALFRARRYPDARTAFAALGDDPEARFWHARAVARSGDLDGAIARFESIGASGSPFAARARLLAATLLADAPATEERAAQHFAGVAKSPGDAAIRKEALWRLGWMRYRQTRTADAAESFARLRALETDPIDALRPRYFEIRARERGAGGASLAAEYASLAREMPLTYYGWRASLRAAKEPVARPVAAGPPLGTPTLPSAPVARIEILIEAGLPAEADAEIGALAPRATADADRIALAELAMAAGNAQRANALVAGGRAAELAEGPVAGHERIWQLAWPRAFEADVTKAAAAEGVPRELVWALMREESGFKPDALSGVGARGVLQLMPETAARMARELGLAEPHVDALYEPALNVRLGAHLLGGLVREFSGKLPAAIGGYNAGSAVVSRWLASDGALAEDEWIESIPYDETRAYVRRVLRSLHAYRVLY